MSESETTMTTLAEWLQQPPTVVIYRPDGQLSLDQMPDMASPDAVVCFTTMHEAKRLLKHVKPRKGFRPINLPIDKWLDAIRAEAAKGRTHLSIWHMPGGETMSKRCVRIEDVLKGFEFAVANAMHDEMSPFRHSTQHANTTATCRDGNHRTSMVKSARTCPRCGGLIPNAEQAGLYPGAISYLDGETEICGPCGTEEGLSWQRSCRADPWKEETWAKEQRARWVRK